MNNKKIGAIIIVISIVLGLILVNAFGKLNEESIAMGCNTEDFCTTIESSFSLVHISFGVLGFLIALGFYLLIFSKGEEMIVDRLEESKNISIQNEKFKVIMSVLNDAEKRVIKAVKEHEGITQSTLMLRTGLSKTKLSYVVNDLEKRGLIKRKPHKKTLKVFLAIKL